MLTIFHSTDLDELVTAARFVGLTAKGAAAAIFGVTEPSTGQVEKARRRLMKLTATGRLAHVEGERGGAPCAVPARGIPPTGWGRCHDPERAITRQSRFAQNRTSNNHAPKRTRNQTRDDHAIHTSQRNRTSRNHAHNHGNHVPLCPVRDRGREAAAQISRVRRVVASERRHDTTASQSDADVSCHGICSVTTNRKGTPMSPYTSPTYTSPRRTASDAYTSATRNGPWSPARTATSCLCASTASSTSPACSAQTGSVPSSPRRGSTDWRDRPSSQIRSNALGILPGYRGSNRSSSGRRDSRRCSDFFAHKLSA